MAADSISDNALAMYLRSIDLTCLSTAVEHCGTEASASKERNIAIHSLGIISTSQKLPINFIILEE